MKFATELSLLPLKKLLIALCISISALTMTGCASSTIKSQEIPIPANLDSSCPGLERLAGVTGKQVIAWATLTVRMYADCQAKVDGLREAWPKSVKE